MMDNPQLQQRLIERHGHYASPEKKRKELKSKNRVRLFAI
jgi:hypothetical protein